MIEGDSPDKDRPIDVSHGRRGKNDNWPGCTKEFVKRTEARRAKNKKAKQARKRNRKK